MSTPVGSRFREVRGRVGNAINESATTFYWPDVAGIDFYHGPHPEIRIRFKTGAETISILDAGYDFYETLQREWIYKRGQP